MTLFRSHRPEGPYEVIGTLPTATSEGDEHLGGYLGAYAPRWHPHYDSEDGLVVSYATHYFSEPNVPDTERDNLYHMPNYAIVPVDLFESVT